MKKRSTKEVQELLTRYRAILFATLTYLEERSGKSFVTDGYDPITEYYQGQRVQVEKYYELRKLDKLQQQFKRLTETLQSRVDLDFATHVKAVTGYDVNIFEDVQERVNALLLQNEIRNDKETFDIEVMEKYYQQTGANADMLERLKPLKLAYIERRCRTSPKPQKAEVKIDRRMQADGIEMVTIRFSTGAKAWHDVEQIQTSPDGKRKLFLTQLGTANSATTTVSVQFPTANGPVYAVQGIQTDIQARWKDNATIIIETQKDYEPALQYKQVSSFDDLITIEYIEHPLEQ